MDKEIKGGEVYYSLTSEEVSALANDSQHGLIFVHMKTKEPDGGIHLNYDLKRGPGSALAEALEKVVTGKGFPVNDVSLRK